MQQVLNDNLEDTSILSYSLSHVRFLLKSRLILMHCLLQCSVSFCGHLSLYELVIHVLTVTVRFLCFRFDLIFMVDLETTMNFTGSIIIILILQILRRRNEHHCSAQIVESLICSCNIWNKLLTSVLHCGFLLLL